MATTNLPGNSQGSLPLPRIVRVRRRKGTSWRALMLVITQSKILLQASLFWSSLKSRTYNNPVNHHTKSKIIKTENSCWSPTLKVLADERWHSHWKFWKGCILFWKFWKGCILPENSSVAGCEESFQLAETRAGEEVRGGGWQNRGGIFFRKKCFCLYPVGKMTRIGIWTESCYL